LNHLQETNTTLKKREPTGFVFEICGQAQRASRQNSLVGEYGPSCNRLASTRL